MHIDKLVDRPVQRFEAAHVQWQPVLRTGAVIDQPVTDAGAAKCVFTGRLQGALQHVSTHTAEKPLVNIAHEPLQIVAHPAAKVWIKIEWIIFICHCNKSNELYKMSSDLCIHTLLCTITLQNNSQGYFFFFKSVAQVDVYLVDCCLSVFGN